MLALSCLRTVCCSSSRTLLHTKWLMTNRQSVYKTITCSAHCVSSSIFYKDTMQSLMRINNVSALRRSHCTDQLTLNCWSCKQQLDQTSAFFCVACKVVQPPEEGTSYFKIMDCAHTFTLDTQKLQKRYLQLQRSLHPDNFSQKSLREQQYSESHSALVNKAYQTLLKPLSRGLYMLQLEGVQTDEGTDSGADSGFLMELMEINEALDEAQTPEGAGDIGRDIKGRLAVLTDEIDATFNKGELHAAKALLAQMKYYANIEEKVKEKLSDFM